MHRLFKTFNSRIYPFGCEIQLIKRDNETASKILYRTVYLIGVITETAMRVIFWGISSKVE